jgi:CDP-diacylglycerol--glycerol-3-phosphate 3-phosphatidyltransferase
MLFGKIWTFLVDRFTGRNAKNFEVRDRFMTRANMVTLTGIIWTFLYVALYAFGIAVKVIPVLVVFIVLTDALDGYFADRFNEHSSYGKFMDPLRDRLFTLALLGNIFLIGGVATIYPIAVLVVAEICLALYYRDAYLSTGKMLNVHWLGKARSALQWLLGFGVLIQFYWLGVEYISPFCATFIMAIASIAVYQYTMLFRKD